MTTSIPLHREIFTTTPTIVCSTSEWRVLARRYTNGIASLTLENSRGYIELLPFMGQMIWDVEFDGVSLRMKNMFKEPKQAHEISDTYGCFAFHSGLLTNGCPGPNDTHPLHGEFPCMELDHSEVLIDSDTLTVTSTGEYIKGFGSHYEARPSLTMYAGRGTFDINLSVTNLSTYAPMPLQYMCHMNYAFIPGGVMSQSIPKGAFCLRETVPEHVHPTPEWEDLNRKIRSGEYDQDSLEGAEAFDPEIVYFADNLDAHGDYAEFMLSAPAGYRFITRFSPQQFPVATRWILHNPDQSVAAFVLPGTSRPEGAYAARKSGTLIELQAGETRSFHVQTGFLAADEELIKEN